MVKKWSDIRNMNKQEMKAKAKEFAFKNKWNIWEPYLTIYAISFVIGLILGFLGLDSENALGMIITIALELALIPASIGYAYYLINLVNGKKLDIKEALLSKYNCWKVILLATIVVGLCTFAWSLLLIIPGIIYSFKVIMTSYILAENEDENLSFKEVINKSKEMMDGYKMDYFKYMLGFFIWELAFVILVIIIYGSIAMTVFSALLGNSISGFFGLLFIVACIGIIGLSISSIWVFPYMQVAKLMYYQELKKLKEIK